MAQYTFSAIVNYPETEAETPTFHNLNKFEVASAILKLLETEPDLTSTLITVVKQKED